MEEDYDDIGDRLSEVSYNLKNLITKMYSLSILNLSPLDREILQDLKDDISSAYYKYL